MKNLAFFKNGSFNYEMHSFIRVVHGNRSLLPWTNLITSCITRGSWTNLITSWITRGAGKNEWNPRGFIAPNPRKMRGVHALRGFSYCLQVYYYYLHNIYKFYMFFTSFLVHFLTDRPLVCRYPCPTVRIPTVVRCLPLSLVNPVLSEVP